MGKLLSRIKEKIGLAQGEQGPDESLDPSQNQVAKRLKKIQFIAIFSFLCALGVLVVHLKGNVSIDSLTKSTADNPLASILILLLLFAIKSFSIIIPLPSLYLASGLLFSPLKAVLVSYLGLSISLTIPYLLGRWSGTEEMDYLKSRYPKIEKLIAMQKKNEFLASFTIRIIGWFPCDILSFYFGACRTTYKVYLPSALLGCSIGVITNTLLGDVLLDPLSWQFILLLVIKILISAGAFALAYHLNKSND